MRVFLAVTESSRVSDVISGFVVDEDIVMLAMVAGGHYQEFQVFKCFFCVVPFNFNNGGYKILKLISKPLKPVILCVLHLGT